MPTITLQDGTEVHISQESYDALAQAVKPKELTYEDVAYSLFLNKKSFYSGAGGAIFSSFFDSKVQSSVTDPDNAPTEQQVKQLLALNKLFNVAYFLNEGWVPDWSDKKQKKYMIVRDGEINMIGVVINIVMHHIGGVYFKSEELAKRAMAILGEKSIKECFGIFE